MSNFFKFAVLVLFFGISTTFAEEVEINMTAGYANDVWYSLETGVVKSEPKDNWDIAFEIGALQTAGIWFNSQKGMQLWVVPGSTADTWGTAIDTTGIGTWQSLNNSIESWDIGGFNMGKNGYETDGDYGWGMYNKANHAVTGEKVFVIKFANGQYKAFFIDALLNKTYTFKYADLDGNNQITKEVSKQDFSTKNFIYYSFEAQDLVDREPDNDTWDLQFGKYTGMVMQGGTPVPYPVTGVRTNFGIRTARITGIDPYKTIPPELNDANYSPSITKIGDDWKQFNGQKFVLVENLSFFVTRSANDDENPIINKIVFKSFDGSSTGKLVFELNPILSVDYKYGSSEISIYPNVVDANSTVNIKLNSEAVNGVTIKLLNMAGVEIAAEYFSESSVSGKYPFELPVAAVGMYIITIENGNQFYSGKIIVR